MKTKLLTLMTLVMLCVTMSAQNECGLWNRARNLKDAGKLQEARNLFVRIKSACPDHIKDCNDQIRRIDGLLTQQRASRERTQSVFKLSTDEVTIPYQGGDFPVTVYGSKSFEVTVDADWCTVRKNGNGVLIACPKENESLRSRTAVVTVTSGTQYKKVTVINEGAPEMLRASVSNISFPADGESEIIDIVSNISWKLDGVPQWLTAAIERNRILLTAATNSQSVEREAQVRIVSPSDTIIFINIYQGAGDEKLSFSKNDLNFGPDGGDEYIRVYTDAPDWKFGDFPNWCQVTRIGKDSLKIHCTPNPPISVRREASVNVTTGNQTLGINIFQEAKPIVDFLPRLSIGGRQLSFGIKAGYIMPNISASSGGNFTGSPVNYSFGDNSEEVSYSEQGGFTVGAFADMRIYKNLYLIAGINITHYGYKNEFYSEAERAVILPVSTYYGRGKAFDRYKEEYTFNTLEIPIMASYRFPVTKISHVQINVGPVISYGLSAKMKISGNTDAISLDSYSIINHRLTDIPYDQVTILPQHKSAEGEFDLYSKHVDYTEILSTGEGYDNHKSQDFDSSPFNRLNFGARIGAAYEYAGVSLGIEYNFMLTNMANKKYWDGKRWTIFDVTSPTLMAGYKQRNSYLEIKLGYTFRY